MSRPHVPARTVVLALVLAAVPWPALASPVATDADASLVVVAQANRLGDLQGNGGLGNDGPGLDTRTFNRRFVTPDGNRLGTSSDHGVGSATGSGIGTMTGSGIGAMTGDGLGTPSGQGLGGAPVPGSTFTRDGAQPRPR